MSVGVWVYGSEILIFRSLLPHTPMHSHPQTMKLSLKDLDLTGKRVLVRVDFNVPLKDDGTVGDDTRIRAALPTIRHILDAGGRPILMSHLGRPGGEPSADESLEPVARHLQEVLGEKVHFAGQTVGDEAEQAVHSLPDGHVLLLENTRFQPEERANDAAFSEKLAALADVYVNDAFGAAHRAHASTAGTAEAMQADGKPAAMGLLLKSELDALGAALDDPEHPFVAVLGGAKVSDKIGVIEALLGKVDRLLIGGAMSYTFLKGMGRGVGTSKVEDDRLDEAKKLHEQADGRIELPTDHVAADAFENDAEKRTVEGDIPDGLMGLDIGPDTIRRYQEIIEEARTVLWNGPMGVFEMPSFAAGTNAIGEALATATERGAYTVVGGGDSVAAVTEAGLEDAISHVSTGGGAMLTFLEGETLPGVEALSEA